MTCMPRSAFMRGLSIAVLAACLPLSAWAQTTDAGIGGPTLTNDKPVQIESDKLEVHQKENTAVFSGNVSVVQGDTLLKAGKLTVHYAKQAGKDGKPAPAGAKSGTPLSGGASQIESLEADGKVYVKSKDQIATGDHGNFNMKTRVLVLSGDEVVLTQGDNVIVGCKLTVHMKTGEARLDSCNRRVKMLLKPDEKQRDQASQ